MKLKNSILTILFLTINILGINANTTKLENLSLLPTTTISASSEYHDYFNKSKAIDGNEYTIWGSSISDKEPYLIINLENKCYLTKVVIKWVKYFHASKFKLAVSNDLETWYDSGDLTSDGNDFEIDIADYNLNFQYI